jgi:hypothetical protein
MAITNKTSSWGYTNNVDSAATITPKALGLKSNYAVVTDTSNEVVLVNTTTPIDQTEVVTLRHSVIPKVNTSSTLPVPNPAPVKTGVSYQVQSEVTLRTTGDDGSITDHPIVFYTSIRHERSGDLTAAVVQEAFIRHISCFLKNDGTYRFNELMRSALQPATD